jgi:hypothetical protein
MVNKLNQFTTTVDASINFQYMAIIPINTNADTPLIMLQDEKAM